MVERGFTGEEIENVHAATEGLENGGVDCEMQEGVDVFVFVFEVGGVGERF